MVELQKPHKITKNRHFSEYSVRLLLQQHIEAKFFVSSKLFRSLAKQFRSGLKMKNDGGIVKQV